jgi:ectoine hydroxylase
MGDTAAVSGITEGERYFFEANGYLVIRDALGRDDLARVRAAADAAEARWRADPSLPGPRRPDLDNVFGILEYHPVFLEMMENPRVLPVVRDLLGPDLMLVDHDYFLSPPGAVIQRGWHYDESFPGVYHPRSRLLVKVFYVLQDIPPDGGATLILPGSHCFPADLPLANPELPEDLPGSVAMSLPAGAAYLMSGRTYHSAGSNGSTRVRKLLIYTYGHKWMRVWDRYEASPELAACAATPLTRQLLGLTDPYGANAPLPDPPATPTLPEPGETGKRAEPAAPAEPRAPAALAEPREPGEPAEPGERAAAVAPVD